MDGDARQPQVLRGQVIRLFDRFDHVSRAIDGVRAEIGWVRDRISTLSRQVEEQQRILNQRAAEAYMAGLTGGIDSVLGASSITDFQDALQFLDAVSRADHDVLISLERRKAQFQQQRIRLGRLEVELRARRERLEATVGELVEELQRQQALLRGPAVETAPHVSVQTSPAPAPLPSPSPPSQAPGRGVVTRLIRDEFASLGSGAAEIALCVAEEESGLDPLAANPATQAAGLFQFVPATWASLSDLAGWDGVSAFDARANAAVAAWTVAHYGWHPWRSVAADCAA
jgi:Transglycosylase SLT domain